MVAPDDDWQSDLSQNYFEGHMFMITNDWDYYYYEFFAWKLIHNLKASDHLYCTRPIPWSLIPHFWRHLLFILYILPCTSVSSIPVLSCYLLAAFFFPLPSHSVEVILQQTLSAQILFDPVGFPLANIVQHPKINQLTKIGVSVLKIVAT